ncbi:hypothetical protein Droror1_Dr00018639 [Drosera rotundifolia]
MAVGFELVLRSPAFASKQLDITRSKLFKDNFQYFPYDFDEQRLRDNYEEAFILWNPATREVELLPYPLPPFTPPQVDYHTHHIRDFGFGYDPSSDDYKILAVIAPDDEDLGGWFVEVYSLREGSWKFLPTKCFNESMCGAFGVHRRLTLNGKMCDWINQYSDSLISFDLTDETFLKTLLHDG